MRFILTKNSNEFIESLAKDKLDIQNNPNPDNKSVLLGIPIQSNNKSSMDKISSFHMAKTILRDTNEVLTKGMKKSWSVANLGPAKNLVIKQKKISLPAIAHKKYNQNIGENNLLPSLPQGLVVKAKQSSNSFFNEFSPDNSLSQFEDNAMSFTLKDIINEKTIKNLKKELKNNESEGNFKNLRDLKVRSNYRELKKIDEMDIIMDNVKISSSKINLIKYINQKSSISESMINKLANYDDEKINRMNKICQKLLEKNNQDDLFKVIMEEKHHNEMKKIKIESKKFFENYRECFDRINKISSEYDMTEYKMKKKELIREKHITLKRQFWDNPFLEKITENIKLSRKKKLSTDISSFIVDQNFSSTIKNK